MRAAASCAIASRLAEIDAVLDMLRTRIPILVSAPVAEAADDEPRAWYTVTFACPRYYSITPRRIAAWLAEIPLAGALVTFQTRP